MEDEVESGVIGVKQRLMETIKRAEFVYDEEWANRPQTSVLPIVIAHLRAALSHMEHHYE